MKRDKKINGMKGGVSKKRSKKKKLRVSKHSQVYTEMPSSVASALHIPGAGF